MNPREAHVGKSIPQRQGYWRYIEAQDYQPTVDESLAFDQTTNSGEELREPSGTARRRVPLRTKLMNHFAQNWFNWLVGAFTLLLLWLMIDSKVAVASLIERIASLKESVTSMKSTDDSNVKSLNDQSLQINENKLRIEFLEKEMNKK